jgi:hypothetical protein
MNNSTVSINSVEDFLKSQGDQLSPRTTRSYLQLPYVFLCVCVLLLHIDYISEWLVFIQLKPREIFIYWHCGNSNDESLFSSFFNSDRFLILDSDCNIATFVRTFLLHFFLSFTYAQYCMHCMYCTVTFCELVLPKKKHDLLTLRFLNDIFPWRPLLYTLCSFSNY